MSALRFRAPQNDFPGKHVFSKHYVDNSMAAETARHSVHQPVKAFQSFRCSPTQMSPTSPPHCKLSRSILFQICRLSFRQTQFHDVGKHLSHSWLHMTTPILESQPLSVKHTFPEPRLKHLLQSTKMCQTKSNITITLDPECKSKFNTSF